MPNAINTASEPANRSADMANADPVSVSIAVKMAKGMVWVRPVRLPANIIVAPNSEMARAHANASPPRIDGAAKGIVTRQNVAQGDTPKLWEMSSYSRPTDWNPNLAALM